MNTTTGAQRHNARQDKIWEACKKAKAEQDTPAQAQPADWQKVAIRLKSALDLANSQRDEARRHAQRLADALSNLIGKIEEMHGCMEVNYAEGHEECYPEFDVAREALAQWEEVQ